MKTIEATGLKRIHPLPAALQELARLNFIQPLAHLRSKAPKIAAIAQEEYDAWDEADVDTYAGGGICHFIAEAVQSALYRDGIECITQSSNHEQHVFVVALVKEGIYMVDVPWSVYERGGGFTWYKLPNVHIRPSDVVFYCIDPDASHWDDYLKGD